MRKSKGVSPLLEAILLVVAALSISVVVASWLFTLSSSKALQIENTTNRELQCQFGNILVQSATYNCANNCSSGNNHNLTLTVTNTGRIKLDVKTIFLINTTGSTFSYEFNETKTISPGASVTASNISTGSCIGINRSIEKITVSSILCPKTAYDSIPGSGVTYTSCG